MTDTVHTARSSLRAPSPASVPQGRSSAACDGFFSVRRSSAPVFGTAGRGRQFYDSPTKTPGPGAYEHEPTPPFPRPLSESPGVTMGPADRILSRDLRAPTPGPGAYGAPDPARLNGGHAARPGVYIARSGRTTPRDGAPIPGPCSYDVTPADCLAAGHRRSAPGASFATASRGSVTGRVSGPGPGSYTVPSALSARSTAFATAGRGPSRDRVPVPGPGAYNAESPPQRRGRGTTIGRASGHEAYHTAIDAVRRDAAPGPGAYASSPTTARTRSPVVGTFGSAARFADPRTAPTSRAGTPRARAATPKGAVPMRRLQELRGETMLSHDDHDRRRSVRGGTIARAGARGTASRSTTPGPGAYSPLWAMAK